MEDVLCEAKFIREQPISYVEFIGGAANMWNLSVGQPIYWLEFNGGQPISYMAVLISHYT